MAEHEGVFIRKFDRIEGLVLVGLGHGRVLLRRPVDGRVKRDHQQAGVQYGSGLLLPLLAGRPWSLGSLIHSCSSSRTSAGRVLSLRCASRSAITWPILSPRRFGPSPRESGGGCPVCRSRNSAVGAMAPLPG